MKLALGLALLLCVAGCDKGTDTTSTSPNKKTLRIAFVPKDLTNPVFNCAKIAAEHRAKEISDDPNSKYKVEILWQAPNKTDAAEQAQVIEGLIRQRVDGFAITCNEAGTLKGAIDHAVEAGIPTVCFDSDSPKSKRKYNFGTDDIKAGEILAKETARQIGGKGEIAILSGSSNAPNLQLRCKGARDYLAKNHPGIKVIDTVYCNDRVDKAITDIGTFMKSHPNLNGWLMVGGWPLFGDNALDSIDPSKTKVVSFDGLPKEWQYLENGKCQALVTQDVWGWGETSLNILIDIIEGKEVKGADANGLIACENKVITKENLPEFKKWWKERFGEEK